MHGLCIDREPRVFSVCERLRYFVIRFCALKDEGLEKYVSALNSLGGVPVPLRGAFNDPCVV